MSKEPKKMSKEPKKMSKETYYLTYLRGQHRVYRADDHVYDEGVEEGKNGGGNGQNNPLQ